jgi:Xaa-Pro aminopeptidase
VRPRLYFGAGAASPPGEPIPEPYAFLIARLGTAAFHLDIRPPAELTAPLRQLKSPCELRLLERAIEITCEGHKKAMRAARPGIGEAHLAALIDFEFRSRGARGSSFDPIVASGPNACILHYDRYDRTVAGGDLVLLDIGADFAGYAADVSRTVPASGRFTERQKRLYRIVYEAQEASLRSIRPGVALEEVIQKATDGVAEGLLAMGLIKDRKEVGKYLPHRTSHGIGLDVHDAIVSKLEPGMVITVEPGIYISEDGLGIRIEDDALVTETGYRLLSGGAPRSPEDVERWLQAREF